MHCLSAVNARLRWHLGFAFLTSFVSFLVGLIFLVGLSLGFGSPLWFDKVTLSAVPWWAWLGGVLGTVGLTANVLIFPKLGGVQTAVMPILGQVLMGLLIDSFGLLRSVQIPFLGSQIVGVLLVLAGVFVAIVLPQRGQLAKTDDKAWLWRGGGVLGTLFILSGVYLVPKIGTGQVVMLVLSGLICGSLLVDKFGLFGVAKKAVLPVQILGVVLLLVGVGCIRLV